MGRRRSSSPTRLVSSSMNGSGRVLEGACAVTADGAWAALDVGLLVPRQSGKTSLLVARELAGLFLFGERLSLALGARDAGGARGVPDARGVARGLAPLKPG